MKNSTKIILALVFVLILLNNVDLNITKKPKEFSIDKYQSEGYVAYIVNSENENKEDEITKCTCNGSKVIVHGDGHKTPCPCDVCTCKKESSDNEQWQFEDDDEEDVKKKMKRQIIMLTCEKKKVCIDFLEKEVIKLKQSGWKVGYLENDNLSIVNVEADPAIASQWRQYTKTNQLPQFIKIVDGKYVGHKTGFHDAISIAEWHNE